MFGNRGGGGTEQSGSHMFAIWWRELVISNNERIDIYKPSIMKAKQIAAASGYSMHAASTQAYICSNRHLFPVVRHCSRGCGARGSRSSVSRCIRTAKGSLDTARHVVVVVPCCYDADSDAGHGPMGEEGGAVVPVAARGVCSIWPGYSRRGRRARWR